MPDLLVVERSQNDSQVFHVITQKFVGAKNTSMPIHVAAYDGHSKTFQNGNVNLFPNKLLNMQGKHLKVGTMLYVPYDIYIETVLVVI